MDASTSKLRLGFQVNILGARNLAPMDRLTRSSDPYVIVDIDGHEIHRSKIVKRNTNPTFKNERFRLWFDEPHSSSLRSTPNFHSPEGKEALSQDASGCPCDERTLNFRLYDHDFGVFADDFLGRCRLNFDVFIEEVLRETTADGAPSPSLFVMQKVELPLVDDPREPERPIASLTVGITPLNDADAPARAEHRSPSPGHRVSLRERARASILRRKERKPIADLSFESVRRAVLDGDELRGTMRKRKTRQRSLVDEADDVAHSDGSSSEVDEKDSGNDGLTLLLNSNESTPKEEADIDKNEWAKTRLFVKVSGVIGVNEVIVRQLYELLFPKSTDANSASIEDIMEDIISELKSIEVSLYRRRRKDDGDGAHLKLVDDEKVKWHKHYFQETTTRKAAKRTLVQDLMSKYASVSMSTAYDNPLSTCECYFGSKEVQLTLPYVQLLAKAVNSDERSASKTSRHRRFLIEVALNLSQHCRLEFRLEESSLRKLVPNVLTCVHARAAPLSDGSPKSHGFALELDILKIVETSDRPAITAAAAGVPRPVAKSVGELCMKVQRCDNLPPMDLDLQSDPYCFLSVGNRQIVRTETLFDSLDPVWSCDDYHTFYAHDIHDKIDVLVLDEDPHKKFDFIGRACLSVVQLLECISKSSMDGVTPKHQVEITLNLRSRDLTKAAKGTVTLALKPDYRLSYLLSGVATIFNDTKCIADGLGCQNDFLHSMVAPTGGDIGGSGTVTSKPRLGRRMQGNSTELYDEDMTKRQLVQRVQKLMKRSSGVLHSIASVKRKTREVLSWSDDFQSAIFTLVVTIMLYYASPITVILWPVAFCLYTWYCLRKSALNRLSSNDLWLLEVLDGLGNRALRPSSQLQNDDQEDEPPDSKPKNFSATLTFINEKAVTVTLLVEHIFVILEKLKNLVLWKSRYMTALFLVLCLSASLLLAVVGVNVALAGAFLIRMIRVRLALRYVRLKPRRTVTHFVDKIPTDAELLRLEALVEDVSISIAPQRQVIHSPTSSGEHDTMIWHKTK